MLYGRSSDQAITLTPDTSRAESFSSTAGFTYPFGKGHITEQREFTGFYGLKPPVPASGIRWTGLVLSSTSEGIETRYAYNARGQVKCASGVSV